MYTEVRMTERQWETWVSTLESEALPQGMGHLRTAAGFCCLGVLCHTALQIDLDKTITNRSAAPFRIWAVADGLSYAPPLLKRAVPSELRVLLARRNDTGQSFKDIGAYLRRERAEGRIVLVPPRGGDIGEPVRRREYEPFPESVPVPEPVVVPVPEKEPVPA